MKKVALYNDYQRRKNGLSRALRLLCCLAILTSFSGCEGCRSSDSKTKQTADRLKQAEERRKREKERKKPPFVLDRFTAQPDDPQTATFWYKPGHWTSGVLDARANRSHFVGSLETEVVKRRSSKTIPLRGVPYVLDSSRPALLPKGKIKPLQVSMFVPADAEQVDLLFRLNEKKSGQRVVQSRQLLQRMPPYQYHFVVLADLPERYGYLKSLDSIKPRAGQWSTENVTYYRVALLSRDPRRPMRLPSESLFWTSIAYLLWDDFQPSYLSSKQQQAILDWLHWGGQIVVSGPDTLDSLQGSFLAPYLPAFAKGKKKLSQADVEEISTYFGAASAGREKKPLTLVDPWDAVQLEPCRDAQMVPHTGGLLLERRVGRGRIVVSSFRLSERVLTTWGNYDDFFNACLLRRPPRKFILSRDEDVQVHWASSKKKYIGNRFDPRLNSRLRYMTRDLGLSDLAYLQKQASEDVQLYMPEDQERVGRSVAQWNGFSPATQEARKTLQKAARIEIPRESFILWIVGIYLLVLVLNWLFFRSLGRVEWAWAAAPLIAIACATTVIRLARLDIGFARAVTEVDVLEIQADYSRAHVTRYAALYTSLSTTYDFLSDDSGILIQPLSTVSNSDRFKLVSGQQYTTLHHHHGDETSLRGYLVSSNVTGMVHCEQMCEISGPVSWVQESDGRYRLVNQTSMPLRGVGLIRKNSAGKVETAWVGNLEPEQTVAVHFQIRNKNVKANRWFLKHRNEESATIAKPMAGELSLHQLFHVVQDTAQLQPGQTRLIAWSKADIPGLQIKPIAPQVQRLVLVVAHLDYGPFEEILHDANRPERLRKKLKVFYDKMDVR